MKFSFNYITDEAREKMQELGIRHVRTPEGQWQVWTSTYDTMQQEKMDASDSYEIPVDEPWRKAEKATRVWHPQEDIYYYLIEDCVFRMEEMHSYDYTSFPHYTHNIKSLFDYQPGDQHYRDALLGRPALVERPI